MILLYGDGTLFFKESPQYENQIEAGKFFKIWKKFLTAKAKKQDKIDLNIDNEAEFMRGCIPNLDYSSFRKKIFNVIDKNFIEGIEEIEFTFFYYITTYSLIELWMQIGLTTNDKNEAFMQVAGGNLIGRKDESLSAYVEAFGTFVSNYYQKLA